MIQGKYFSFTSGSVDANIDLITKAETLTGETNIVAKKVRLITSGSLAFSINGISASSPLFSDGLGRYALELDDGDVYVSSLVVKQTTGCPVFLEIIY